VLVVDRDPSIGPLVASALADENLGAATVSSWSEAIERLRDTEVDLLLLEAELVRDRGVQGLEEFNTLAPAPEVVYTSLGEAGELAITSIGDGRHKCLRKPLDAAAIRQIARTVIENHNLARENSALRRLISRQDKVETLVAESPGMIQVLETVRKVAAAKASVLISGETGSGKGLVAQTIHQLSPRASAPFVPINCGALQEQLLESELFGHTKGAFTGAASSKLGLFEVAHGGTLFLDEIAEMSPLMQTRLLQVLDSGSFRQVGGTKLRRVDTRILAATNKKLKAEVRQGGFREDLFYRLNVVRIRVPPLRTRQEDIPGLVEIFLEQHKPPDGPAKRISRRALRVLLDYHWPGNVRELANLVESMSLLAPGDVILPEDLPPILQPISLFESRAIEIPLPLSEMERLHILRALDFTTGKKAPAARMLGIDVKTLRNKIKAYKIEL